MAPGSNAGKLKLISTSPSPVSTLDTVIGIGMHVRPNLDLIRERTAHH